MKKCISSSGLPAVSDATICRTLNLKRPSLGTVLREAPFLSTPCRKDHIDYRSLVSSFHHSSYMINELIYIFVLCARLCSWHFSPKAVAWSHHLQTTCSHQVLVLLLASANLSSALVSGSGQVANNDPQLFWAAGRSCLLWLNDKKQQISRWHKMYQNDSNWPALTLDSRWKGFFMRTGFQCGVPRGR